MFIAFEYGNNREIQELRDVQRSVKDPEAFDLELKKSLEDCTLQFEVKNNNLEIYIFFLLLVLKMNTLIFFFCYLAREFG